MSRQRGALHRWLSAIGLVLILSVLIGGGIGAYWYLGPYRGFGDQTFVEVEHGMSSRAIARQLADQGVVRSRWAFLFVRVLHPMARLQAGEYRFGSAASPWEVFRKIQRGEIFYEDFTVPEGSNIFDIAQLLRNSDTVKADDFLKASADPTMIRDIDPQAPTLEGYLFPSTYRVTHHTTANQLCHAMTAEFRREWAALSNTKIAVDVHTTVTLASLVEKESALPRERPMIAAVFLNRLRDGMALQCDPTTVYAAQLENKYQGVIFKSDLASMNPYNTYTHPGLPPGPIANPGKASLAAALHPVAVGFLYFVAKADGSGSHQFSSTLEQHDKAVLEYRAHGQR